MNGNFSLLYIKVIHLSSFLYVVWLCLDLVSNSPSTCVWYLCNIIEKFFQWEKSFLIVHWKVICIMPHLCIAFKDTSLAFWSSSIPWYNLGWIYVLNLFGTWNTFICKLILFHQFQKIFKNYLFQYCVLSYSSIFKFFLNSS